MCYLTVRVKTASQQHTIAEMFISVPFIAAYFEHKCMHMRDYQIAVMRSITVACM